MSDSHRLTELQIAILSVLWDRAEASTSDVCDALRPERDLAHTTVATLLSRLERRGVVEHHRDGRQYVYRALVSRGDVRSSMLAELTELFFGGDPGALVSHLVEGGEVDAGELARIRSLIDEAGRGSEGDDP